MVVVARRRTKPTKRPPQDAIVDELYTFGTVGVAKEQLRNEQGSGGCFPGMRVRARQGVGKSIYDDLTPPYAKSFKQPLQPFMEITARKKTGPKSWSGTAQQIPCTKNPALPNSGHAQNLLSVCLPCHLDYYNFNYSDPKLATQYVFAFDTYEDGGSKVVIEHATKAGYSIVGRAVMEFSHMFGLIRSKDIAHLYQHKETFDCVLAFEGSDNMLKDLGDWLHNSDYRTQNYCGFQGVARGYSEEILAIVKHKEFVKHIKSKLPQCEKVAVSGHSKGGALANLFAACANRAVIHGSNAQRDYSAVAWRKGKGGRIAPLKPW